MVRDREPMIEPWLDRGTPGLSVIDHLGMRDLIRGCNVPTGELVPGQGDANT
jgi:hypothetical protein